MILMIDNYDSFTFSLVHQLQARMRPCRLRVTMFMGNTP